MRNWITTILNKLKRSKGYDSHSEERLMEKPVVKYECINPDAALLIARSIHATSLVQGSSLITDFGFIGDFNWTHTLIGRIQDSESLTESDWVKWRELKASEVDNELMVV